MTGIIPEKGEIPQTGPNGGGGQQHQKTSHEINKVDAVINLVREEIEKNPKHEAAQLLNELFSVNFTIQEGRYISPLNAESVGQELDQAERSRQLKEKELYTALTAVKKAIEKDGGISEETYESYKYAINSIARDLTGQRFWGSGLSHLCEQEDREGKRATTEQIARFPEDTDPRKNLNDHTNIFDQDDKISIFEGTLFQTEFGPNGNLTTYRIFHQGHRDNLSIRTVKISELVAKIDRFVAEFTEKSPGQQFGFTLDREEYLRKMAKFNEQFGNFVSLEIINDNVVAKINANPQQVAERLVELARQNEMIIDSRMGSTTYMVFRRSDDPNKDYGFADLFLLDHMQGKRDAFNPEKHKDTPTVLLPYLQPEFTNDLITMYATQKQG